MGDARVSPKCQSALVPFKRPGSRCLDRPIQATEDTCEAVFKLGTGKTRNCSLETAIILSKEEGKRSAHFLRTYSGPKVWKFVLDALGLGEPKTEKKPLLPAGDGLPGRVMKVERWVWMELDIFSRFWKRPTNGFSDIVHLEELK
ncbi:hypothetical protein NL676_038952 [Syzygium grande]|nr:hypothetical protein NL676_038952 [Syzygium grande]